MNVRLLVAAVVTLLRGSPAAAESGRLTISVVGTTDLHGRLESLPWLGGYLRILRDARQGAVLVVDAGDMFQGTLESNLGEGAAVVSGYNALGYAAAAIGNHEFDFGPAGPRLLARGPKDDPRGALKMRAGEARFAFLAANLHEVGRREPLAWSNVRPSALVELRGVKVGLVGVTTSSTPHATHPRNFAGLQVTPLAQAIAREATRLRASGAVVVVALAHAGSRCSRFDDPDDVSTCDTDDEIFEVARALPRGLVDVIVAGHTHQGVAHRVNGVAVVQGFANGRAFSRVDLDIDRAARRVIEARILPPRFLCSQTHGSEGRLTSFAPDACRAGSYEGRPVVIDDKVAAALRPFVTRAAAERQRPLGVRLATPFPRHQKQETALGNLLADLMRQARPGADVVLLNGGGIRADIPLGPLTYGRLFETFPFDNAFATVKLSAADLERAFARHLARSGAVLSIAGLTVRARCEAGALAVDLRRPDGARLPPETPITLLTSDFVATGGDGLFEPDEISATLESDPPIREELARLLQARGGVLRADDPALLDPQRPRLALPHPRPVRCPAIDRP